MKNLKEKALNAWLSILEVLYFITDAGPSLFTSGLVSLLTVLAVLKLTGRL